MDTFQILQVVLAALTVFFVWNIGVKQNEINQLALNVTDFVEVFLMPQSLTQKLPDGSEKIVGWNV